MEKWAYVAKRTVGNKWSLWKVCGIKEILVSGLYDSEQDALMAVFKL